MSQNFLRVIDKECDRMARLVRDLLQLSNIDYEKAKWNFVETSLEDLVHEAKMKLDLSFKEKNQTVNIELQEDLPKISVDKDGMEQVILNLLSNANKYTDHNGRIDIFGYTEGDKVILKIKDNGIGISEKDQKRIFERFYRVEKGRSRELGGTGLGLSIAKEIVEAHRGNLKLSSKLNEGTEISVELPINSV